MFSQNSFTKLIHIRTTLLDKTFNMGVIMSDHFSLFAFANKLKCHSCPTFNEDHEEGHQ